MLDFDKQGTERHSWLGSKAAIGFAAGFSADILSLITHTPGEVISVRLMVSTTQLDYRPGCIEATVPVPTARQVFADLWRANGFSGLYRGLGGSIISHGPGSFRILHFVSKC
uniref:Uncharacterized protein n=1 Tax=Spongospora subterranea TaxID=70186 RepID=A0A0H5QZZ6_9EUKA|eukprot:CRZ01149.1 hypothetical protein [Spongospora subterranea]